MNTLTALAAELRAEADVLAKEYAMEADTKREIADRLDALAREEAAPVASPLGCSTHPDAPHGYDRTSSHTLDRYVCDCEGWTPPPTGDA